MHDFNGFGLVFDNLLLMASICYGYVSVMAFQDANACG